MKAARRIRLRARFLLACGLLVLTTVVASAWTLAVLARLSATARSLVQKISAASAALETASSAVEREDDALLSVLSSDDHNRAPLIAARQSADVASARLRRVLEESGELELAKEMTERVAAYRTAVDRLLAGPLDPDVLDRHQLSVNPALRLAVAAVSRIRERFFEHSMQALSRSSEEVARTRGALVSIALAALIVALGVALRLARAVIGPLRQLMEGANAIREGNFEARIASQPGDEIGEVADAFNHMAERLTEFRRVNLEEILRAKGALEATMMALPDAVVLLGADERLITVNQAAAALFHELDAAAPQAAEDLIRAGLAPAALRDVLAGRTGPSVAVDLTAALRCVVRGEDRRLLPRIVRTAREPDGRCGAVLVLSDVTELARLDELRAEHIAVASHELRTPVTTLHMTLLMLKEASEALPPRTRELVSTALVGAEQLGETVDELLDLARIESGRLRLNYELLDLVALAAEAVRRAQQRADDAHVNLTLHADAPLPSARGDRTRLRVVLDNLINNALKYTPVGGAISVAVDVVAGTEAAPSTLQLSVTDTGPGIGPDFRARVFEKFFRVEHHRPGGEGGTRGAGIGLYLCKEIIELHGGRIWCEPGPKGRGTRMLIRIQAEGGRTLAATP